MGDKAENPADTHGKPCCAHDVIGPAIDGSPDVFVNSRKALRVTDPGVHSSCCGPNTWNAAAGSPTVFINNLNAHRLGDETMHCGGPGKLIEGSPDVIVGDVGALAPISQPDAEALFKKMVVSADKIPFDYPNDCCYSRAHEMCRMMKKQGVECGKIWNYRKPGGPPLVADTQNSPSGHVTWRYHVAPTVNVRGNDGTVRTMVVDPSMFDHLVTEEEWRAAQQAPNPITQYTDASPYYRGINGADAEVDPDYSKTNTQFALHISARDQQDPAFVQQLKDRREARIRGNSN